MRSLNYSYFNLERIISYKRIKKKNNTMHANPSSKVIVDPIPIKRVTFLHGEPFVKFTEAEVERMNVIEGLQYVVVGKFSYGWSDLQELRRIIPVQCENKGDCNAGFLRDMHMLNRLTLWEDFINLTSKSPYYIKAKDGYEHQRRPLIYDAKF